ASYVSIRTVLSGKLDGRESMVPQFWLVASSIAALSSRCELIGDRIGGETGWEEGLKEKREL
ncbi:Uncharacterized protein APZ42_000516, partial [Daphnia magna]